MTNEEKAEEYVMREDVDTMKYSECYNERVFFEKEVKKAYLDGLAEGRKEGYEQGKNNERELQCGKKNYEKDIAKLEKENTGLKAQIEKMKNCRNCKNWNWKHSKCEKRLKGDCFKNSKWELAE